MNKENIPFIFTKDSIINKLLIYFQSNGIVVKDKKIHCITNKKIKLLREFNKFFKENIHKEATEELEISELKYLFKLVNKKNYVKEKSWEIYYTMRSDIYLLNKKTILGYSSILWNKKESIISALKKCSIEITNDYIDLYKQYCKCLKDSDNDLIVSKSYFMKNINSILTEFANNY